MIRVNIKTSEFIKLVSNAYLSGLISFWNEIFMISEMLDINTYEVSRALTNDERISKYGCTFHGEPFNGKCLPKDLDTILEVADDVGVHPFILNAIKTVNDIMGDVR